MASQFYTPVCDNKVPSLVASLFSWRCLAASTSSFLHAAINLRPPSVTVSTHTNVQYNGGLLPDIILLSSTVLFPSGNPFKCHQEVLYLQPLIPPKRFDIFPPPNWGMLRRSRCVLIFLKKKTPLENVLTIFPLTGWICLYSSCSFKNDLLNMIQYATYRTYEHIVLR